MTRALDTEGKAALFSGRPRHEGPFRIECSGCGNHSQVSASGLLKLALPFNFTVPLKYHHTWLKCPACRHRRWVKINLT